MELVYISWVCEVSRQPFFVAVDHLKQSLVISIRGTMSGLDVLTDMKGDATPIGRGVPGKAHQGMIECALNIFSILHEEKVLSQAWGKNLSQGTQNYRTITIVGHSLGAGIATILSLLMKSDYDQQGRSDIKIQCFAYSPPGGLLCQQAAKFSKLIVTSVVVGKDLVPRLGLSQLEGLESEIINVLRETDSHKWKIIIASSIGKKIKSKNLLQPHTTEPLNAGSRLKSIKRDQKRFDTLYPPGELYHFLPHYNDDRSYTVHAVRADNDDFQEIIVSGRMVEHHMPHFVQSVLDKYINQPTCFRQSTLYQSTQNYRLPPIITVSIFYSLQLLMSL